MEERTVLVSGCVFCAAGIGCLWLSAMQLSPSVGLELSPLIGCFGFFAFAIYGIAKIRSRSAARSAAWLIRVVTVLFTLAMTGALFLLLPINNLVGADLLDVTFHNSALVLGAGLFFWLTNFALRRASKRDEA